MFGCYALSSNDRHTETVFGQRHRREALVLPSGVVAATAPEAASVYTDSFVADIPRSSAVAVAAVDVPNSYLIANIVIAATMTGVGVLDRSTTRPVRGPSIEAISVANVDLVSRLDARHITATGGMRTRVELSCDAVGRGVPSVISIVAFVFSHESQR